MVLFILNRLLIFIPTILVVSILCFFLSRVAPRVSTFDGHIVSDSSICQESKRRNLYKPLFYFSFTSKAFPKDLYKECNPERRKAKEKLIAQYGNWPEINAYFAQLKFTRQQFLKYGDSLAYQQKNDVRSILGTLPMLYKNQGILSRMDSMKVKVSGQPFIKEAVHDLQAKYVAVRSNATRQLIYTPTIYWYGTYNQYHHWVSNFFGINESLGFKSTFPFINWQPNMGVSYETGLEVIDRIKHALWWTVLLNSLSLFFIFTIAIPLGVYAAKYKDGVFDRISGLILFMMFSLPGFWVGTLLLVFLTNPEYLQIFPTPGFAYAMDTPVMDRFWDISYKLILPVFCLSYPAIAYISRQMRGSILNVFQMDFIRTAKAKGLSMNKVVWKHSFRNSLLPIITIIASIFPGMISGAIIIESIFSVPGMGRLLITAIQTNDWPIVFAVMLLGTILTLIGILVADILYAIADPRISVANNS